MFARHPQNLHPARQAAVTDADAVILSNFVFLLWDVVHSGDKAAVFISADNEVAFDFLVLLIRVEDKQGDFSFLIIMSNNVQPN